MPEVQFYSEIAPFAPAEIKFEPVAFVINKGQIDDPAPGDGKVPAAVRVARHGGMDPVSHRLFVRHPDHIIAEVFKRVAQVPHEIPAGAIRAIPVRRARFINVSEPPDRIDFVIEVDGRKIGARHHDDAVPVGLGCGRIGRRWFGRDRTAAGHKRQAGKQQDRCEFYSHQDSRDESSGEEAPDASFVCSLAIRFNWREYDGQQAGRQFNRGVALPAVEDW